MTARRPIAMVGGLFLILLGLILQLRLSTSSRASTGISSSESSTPAFSSTEVITRDHLNVDGSNTVVDTRNFTVNVNRNTSLRGNQQLRVTWDGGHPTGGVVGDQSSATAAAYEEYPVVLMECRGLNSSSAPASDQIDPTTCWTQTSSERYSSDSNSAYPAWRLDHFASTLDIGPHPGQPTSLKSACTSGQSPLASRWVPFVAADGTVYEPGYFAFPGCNPLAPEASNVENSNAPGNTTYGVTGLDGKGSSKFVVWTADQNASLGCSSTVPCALVIVPIMGVSCATPATAGESPTDDTDCRSAGVYQPGEFFNPSHNAPSVTGALWWTSSNWRHRITVPLGFAESSSVCSVVNHSDPVLLYGSPPLAEATEQWAPFFCTDPRKFTFRHVQTGEPSVKNLLGLGLSSGSTMDSSPSPSSTSTRSSVTPSPTASASSSVPSASNGVEAVLESDAPPGGYSRPTVQAPVALTGFSISYIIDDKNGHEYPNLRLTPRLLAKLLTESYPDIPEVYKAYPALSRNPWDITRDPEFIALNPGIPLDASGQDSGSTLYSISSNADTMFALTSYIDADPEARSWLDGQPDPWGMVVNANYRGISLPVESWPLLDSFIASFGHAGNNDCVDEAPVPYLPLIASPTAALSAVAQALEFAAPLSQTNCVLGGGSGALGNKLTTGPRQIPGQRFMIGLTSLGEAAFYGLDSAALQTYQVAPDATSRFTNAVGRLFSAPTNDSLIAAARLASPDETTGTWPIAYSAMRNNPADAGAYPGAMFVYLAVPTAGLPATDAGNFASFMRFAVTSGQTPGFGNGQLPDGYAPMTARNGLGDQVAFSLRAAAAVATQKGGTTSLLGGDEPVVSAPPRVSATPPPSAPVPAATAPASTHTGRNAPAAPPTSAPSTTQAASSLSSVTPSSAPTSAPPVPLTATTVAHSSSIAGSVLPSILAIGLGAFFIAAGLRFKVTP